MILQKRKKEKKRKKKEKKRKKKRIFCGELSFEIMGTSMSTSFQTENRIEFVARIVTIDLLIYLFI
jgi:uncharacterized protein YggL (DUF469 family)